MKLSYGDTLLSINLGPINRDINFQGTDMHQLASATVSIPVIFRKLEPVLKSNGRSHSNKSSKFRVTLWQAEVAGPESPSYSHQRYSHYVVRRDMHSYL